MMHVEETMNGHDVTLIDEEFNVLVGEKTGVWIKNRFYPVDEEGRALIPYRKASTSTEKVILVHKGFAKLYSLTVLKENFSFKCAYLYELEHFLPGSEAEVLIKP